MTEYVQFGVTQKITRFAFYTWIFRCAFTETYLFSEAIYDDILIARFSQPIKRQF